ncbi:C1 family peptidase [Mangrovibacterium diazotrophicum]|uniref:Aminopeptidase n=1 Tax=Mangrovibacterium diazotrophicum TaxID=1261403 RepID=A0A419W857_9BACT|nr:C1 family peptidase [Mangrovibacterium diazotrophicum]RKD91636.1 bleomycin hydrolase [Mangrovibacterium diazotrophicum]
MSKLKWLMLAGLALPFIGTAQSIDQQQLETIRSGYVKDNYTVGMENALSSNPITKLAWSRDNEGTTDHYFTYRVDVSGITDQKASGRCWLFTSLNVFRPMAMQHFNTSSFEFSQNYLYFWDLFEKSNLFLNNIVATADRGFDDEKVRWYLSSPVDDGGQWINFVNLANKYGMVPKEAMEETYSSENTAWMTKLIKRKLREQALELRDMKNGGKNDKQIEARKVEMLGVIYRMLALNLGEPPVEFEYRYKDKDNKLADTKTYTPQSFMKEVLGDIQLSDYVMLMNDPTRPYWKHYEVENYRNVQEGENWHYVNLPNDVIKQFCIESIKNNEAMYASCDVGKQLRKDFGVLDVDNFNYEAVYNVPFNMNKAQRIETKDSGSSHGMALIAVEVDKDEKPLKWQFENSWGAAAGEKGYLTFTDRWFDEYMFRIVVNKKYISPKVLDIYGQKSEMLPPWDPMF